MVTQRLPSRIYLDTSFVIASLFAGIAHSGPCIQFCGQLSDRGTRVYFSQLVRLEIAQALKNIATRRPPQLPEHLRRQYRLQQWASDPGVRRRWIHFGFSQLEALLGTFRAAA